MEFPTTLIEFQDRFPDEESCWRYLKAARWPEGFRCPHCGHRQHSYLESRRLFQCASCRVQTSVTAQTILHRTRTSLRRWFLAIFFFARHKQSISALQLQRDLGLGSYETAWTMLHKLRSALGRRPEQLLSGPIEADETFVGGPRSGGKTGRGAPNKTMVLILVERRPHSAGGAVLQVVPSGSWASLGPPLLGAIEGRNATVWTDERDRLDGRLARLRPARSPCGAAPLADPGHGRAGRDDPALDAPGGLEPQGLAARHLPWRQPQTPATLPRRVRLPLQPAQPRREALLLRHSPGARSRALPLPPTHSGVSRISTYSDSPPGKNLNILNLPVPLAQLVTAVDTAPREAAL